MMDSVDKHDTGGGIIATTMLDFDDRTSLHTTHKTDLDAEASPLEPSAVKQEWETNHIPKDQPVLAFNSHEQQDMDFRSLDKSNMSQSSVNFEEKDLGFCRLETNIVSRTKFVAHSGREQKQEETMIYQESFTRMEDHDYIARQSQSPDFGQHQDSMNKTRHQHALADTRGSLPVQRITKNAMSHGFSYQPVNDLQYYTADIANNVDHHHEPHHSVARSVFSVTSPRMSAYCPPQQIPTTLSSNILPLTGISVGPTYKSFSKQSKPPNSINSTQTSAYILDNSSNSDNTSSRLTQDASNVFGQVPLLYHNCEDGTPRTTPRSAPGFMSSPASELDLGLVPNPVLAQSRAAPPPKQRLHMRIVGHDPSSRLLTVQRSPLSFAHACAPEPLRHPESASMAAGHAGHQRIFQVGGLESASLSVNIVSKTNRMSLAGPTAEMLVACSAGGSSGVDPSGGLLIPGASYRPLGDTLIVGKSLTPSSTGRLQQGCTMDGLSEVCPVAGVTSEARSESEPDRGPCLQNVDDQSVNCSNTSFPTHQACNSSLQKNSEGQPETGNRKIKLLVHRTTPGTSMYLAGRKGCSGIPLSIPASYANRPEYADYVSIAQNDAIHTIEEEMTAAVQTKLLEERWRRSQHVQQHPARFALQRRPDMLLYDPAQGIPRHCLAAGDPTHARQQYRAPYLQTAAPTAATENSNPFVSSKSLREGYFVVNSKSGTPHAPHSATAASSPRREFSVRLTAGRAAGGGEEEGCEPEGAVNNLVIPSPFLLQTGLERALGFAEYQPMSPCPSAGGGGAVIPEACAPMDWTDMSSTLRDEQGLHGFDACRGRSAFEQDVKRRQDVEGRFVLEGIATSTREIGRGDREMMKSGQNSVSNAPSDDKWSDVEFGVFSPRTLPAASLRDSTPLPILPSITDAGHVWSCSYNEEQPVSHGTDGRLITEHRDPYQLCTTEQPITLQSYSMTPAWHHANLGWPSASAFDYEQPPELDTTASSDTTWGQSGVEPQPPAELHPPSSKHRKANVTGDSGHARLVPRTTPKKNAKTLRLEGKLGCENETSCSSQCPLKRSFKSCESSATVTGLSGEQRGSAIAATGPQSAGVAQGAGQGFVSEEGGKPWQAKNGSNEKSLKKKAVKEGSVDSQGASRVDTTRRADGVAFSASPAGRTPYASEPTTSTQLGNSAVMAQFEEQWNSFYKSQTRVFSALSCDDSATAVRKENSDKASDGRNLNTKPHEEGSDRDGGRKDDCGAGRHISGVRGTCRSVRGGERCDEEWDNKKKLSGDLAQKNRSSGNLERGQKNDKTCGNHCNEKHWRENSAERVRGGQDGDECDIGRAGEECIRGRDMDECGQCGRTGEEPSGISGWNKSGKAEGKAGGEPEGQTEWDLERLLAAVLALTLASWEEYLTTDQLQMHRYELERALACGYTQDALEMIRNRDLEVWRVIDNMAPPAFQAAVQGNGLEGDVPPAAATRNRLDQYIQDMAAHRAAVGM